MPDSRTANGVASPTPPTRLSALPTSGSSLSGLQRLAEAREENEKDLDSIAVFLSQPGKNGINARETVGAAVGRRGILPQCCGLA